MRYVQKANFIDIHNRLIKSSDITVCDGKIAHIAYIGNEDHTLPYIMPGFVDAHIHIESSLLVPSQFARLAVCHGTVATVSDPHEIANVCGVEGVRYMVRDGARTRFKFCFGAPSCVPATIHETAGATLTSADIEMLLQEGSVHYLAEVMNYPGVIHDDPDILAKLAVAHRAGVVIDGHAPGLRGKDLSKYISHGITTDHEAYTYDEGLEKLKSGMKILVREGSAAKNFEALAPLITDYWKQMMFCSDDKHPDSLLVSHIDELVRRAWRQGHDPYHLCAMACMHPVEHYHLPVGRLRVGDPADYILIDAFNSEFEVTKTVIDGHTVYDGMSRLPDVRAAKINNFQCRKHHAAEYAVRGKGKAVPIICAIDQQLITECTHADLDVSDGCVQSNLERDILKITVVNRYKQTDVSCAFITGSGLKRGAIASSVAHDSHNVIAIGADDKSLSQAVNTLIESEGGLCAVLDDTVHHIPLPIAGLMTDVDAYTIAQQYTELDVYVKQVLGSTLTAPFMTLSFMALLVIPHLKLSDKGLFDGDKFKIIPHVS